MKKKTMLTQKDFDAAKEQFPAETNGMDELLKRVHSVGLQTGRAELAQGFALLAEFFKYKAMQEIVESREVLEKMGYSSVDDYFSAARISRSKAYGDLRIARSFSPLEVDFFGQIGLTRQDLLMLAPLPEEDRHELKDRLEKADKDEIRELIEQKIEEFKAQFADQRKAFDDEMKKATKTITVKDAAITFLEGENAKVIKYLPKKPMTESAKHLHVVKQIHSDFMSALSGLDFVALEAQDSTICAEIDGIVAMVRTEIEMFDDKWQRHKKGEVIRAAL